MLWVLFAACGDRVPVDPDGEPPLSSPTGETAGTTGTTGATGDTAIQLCPACDDALDCSLDYCDAGGSCFWVPAYDCAWPAAVVESVAPTELGLQVSLSGATYDAVNRRLWLVRNSGPGAIWRLVQDLAGEWVVDVDPVSGVRAEWLGISPDIESLTIVDPVAEPDIVYLVVEGEEIVVAFDLSEEGVIGATAAWDTSEYLPLSGALGSEAITFVPDEGLAAAGFVDGDGVPRTSAGGMGGLMLVGHQNGGKVYAFDLGPFGIVEHVGTYATARAETSGMEYDPSTGRLYLWHGQYNDLEVARLSSTDVGETFRKLDTEYVFDHPSIANMEGVALMPTTDCVDGKRGLFLITDDGGPASAQEYLDWPLCR